MLNVLGKIRRKLIAEQRASNYLLYALGEIVLIVIGILIAVQINDWNSARKARQLERGILVEMQDDLQKTMADLDYDLERHISRLASSLLIQEFLAGELPYHDSLDRHFTLLRDDYQVFPKLGAFELLRARGLELISNDSLRRSVTDLFELDMPRVVTSGVDYTGTRNINALMTPMLDRHATLSSTPLNKSTSPRLSAEPVSATTNITVFAYTIRDHNALRADDTFRIKLQDALVIRRKKIRDHLELKQQIENALLAIRNHLATLN
ncbi:MAG: hypothetical protein KDC54_02805 [Lewinella sp.]|nr:hypothetical protein [Lewinella sp.]